MKLEVEPNGLGYRAFLTGEGIGIEIDRLVEARGELAGELTVARAPEGHLLRSRFNLTSMTTRASTAKFLQGRSPLTAKGGPDWTTILESFCLGVLRHERDAPHVTSIGGPDRPARVSASFVLEPLILGGNLATILYGDGGVGKSTIAAAAAVSVASGTPALPGWRVDRPRPVMVCDWEADERDWHDLVAGVSDGLDIEAPLIDYMACDRSLPSMIHALAREVTDREIGLLIVDSVGHALPSARDGASAEEGAMALFKALRMLGVPALLIDHVAKGADIRDGPYGSRYKWNSARALWELRSGEEDGSHLALIHRKHNLTKRYPPVGLRLERGDGRIVLHGEDVASDPALSSVAMTIAQRIERLLLAAPKPMTINDLAERVGTGPKTIAVTLNRSARFVKVGQEGRHQLWAVNYNMEVQQQHNNAQQPLTGGVVQQPPLPNGREGGNVSPTPVVVDVVSAMLNGEELLLAELANDDG